MSDVKLTIGADASLLAQEIEKAAGLLRNLTGEADITGKNLQQSYDLARQSQRALNEQLTLLGSQLRKAKSEYVEQRAEVKRYKTVVDQLKGTLADLEKQHKKDNAMIQQTRKSLKEAETAYKANTLRLEEYAATKRNITQQMDRYRNALGAVSVASKRLESTNTGLVRSNTSLSGSFQRTLGFARQLAGAFGFGLGLYGLVRAIRGAVSAITTFDQKMRTLAAISGATEREMESLSRTAIKVGSSTIYGAEGVGELMTQLAKMGFAVDEIEKMSEGIARLATASNEGLEPAAELVANVIRAMGYDAQETGRIVDTMALSFTRSALDLSRFRESMKYIAPLATQAGFSIENVAAVLAKLADAGIRGSLAGTSMRNVFSALADQSSALSKKLGGNIKSFDEFIDAMGMLADEGIEVGEMFNLIDRRAVTALVAIKDNAGSIRTLNTEMQDANGAADEMANIQMQAITKQTTLAQQALKGLVLAIDQGDGALSQIIRKSLRKFTSAISETTKNLISQSRQMEQDVRAIETMSRAINDSNRSFDDRLELVKELGSEYPELFADMDVETAKWKEITEAIDGAIERKKAILRLQFVTEDIQDATDNIKEQESAYRDLSREVRLFWSSLSSGDQDRLTGILDGTYQSHIAYLNVLNEINKDGKELTVGFKNQLEELIKIKQALGDSSDELVNYTQFQKDLAITTIDIETAVSKYFEDEVQERTDFYVEKMKEMADADVESGKNRIQAFDGASLAVVESIEKQMQAYLDLNEANNDNLELIEGNSVTERRERALILKSIKNNEAAYEILRNVILKVLSAKESLIDASGDEIKETEDMLRLQWKLAEVQARIDYDSITLQEKLSKLRLEYMQRIARATLSNEELDKQIRLNELQHELEMQGIAASRIKQTEQLEEAAYRRKADRMQREQQLADIYAFGEGQTPREAALQRELSLLESSIRVETDLRDIARDNELRQVESQLKELESQWKGSADELVRLQQELADKRTAINQNYIDESVLAEERAAIQRLKIEEDINKAKLEALKDRQFLNEREAEWQREQAEYEAERVRGIIDAMDLLGQRTRRMRETERRNEIERLEERQKEIEDRREILRLKLAELRSQLSATTSPAQQGLIAQQIFEIEAALDDFDFEDSKLNTLIDRLRNPELDISEWQQFLTAMKGVANQLTGIYQNMLDERHQLAQEELALRDKNISELQKDLDLQLRLNEQGFASNVQAYAAMLEQEKLMREQALKEEQKQAAEKRRLETLLQGLNLLTAISNILKVESIKGLVGIGTAAAGLAGLWAVWSRAQSKVNTQTYEKGGSFMLEGPSHANGGINIARGHEAQGGEMVSVFSRAATKKYGSDIRSVTDMFNKGHFQNPISSTPEFDTRDIKAIRRLLEKDTVKYESGYKIIKKGNTTIRCQLN